MIELWLSFCLASLKTLHIVTMLQLSLFMIMKCNSTLLLTCSTLLLNKLFSLCPYFHILKPLLNHIVKIPIPSLQSHTGLYLRSSLSCPHSFYSLHFSHSVLLHIGVCLFGGWLDYPYWNSCSPYFRSSAKSIRRNIQITLLFSAIHTTLLLLVMLLQSCTGMFIWSSLQLLCLLLYLIFIVWWAINMLQW